MVDMVLILVACALIVLVADIMVPGIVTTLITP